MKRQSYRNVYGKRIIRLNTKMVPSNLVKPDLSSEFNRVVKVTESLPKMGEQRFSAKQKIGRGLRML